MKLVLQIAGGIGLAWLVLFGVPDWLEARAYRTCLAVDPTGNYYPAQTAQCVHWRILKGRLELGY